MLEFLLLLFLASTLFLAFIVLRQRGRMADQRARWREDIDAAREEGRADSRQRSRSTNLGQAIEHLVPFMSDFPFDPKDAKFLGNPVDYVVFAGLREDDRVEEVVFVEVKAGKGTLTRRERSIRDAIESGRVAYHVQYVPMPSASPD